MFLFWHYYFQDQQKYKLEQNGSKSEPNQAVQASQSKKSNSTPNTSSAVENDSLPRADTGGWRELHKITNQNAARILSANQKSAFDMKASSEAASANESTRQQFTENGVLFQSSQESLPSEENVQDRNASVTVDQLSNQLSDAHLPLTVNESDNKFIFDHDQTTISPKLDPNKSSIYDEYVDSDPDTSKIPTKSDSHTSAHGSNLYDDYNSNRENLW